MAICFPALCQEANYQQSPQGTEVPYISLVAHGTVFGTWQILRNLQLWRNSLCRQIPSWENQHCFQQEF